MKYVLHVNLNVMLKNSCLQSFICGECRTRQQRKSQARAKATRLLPKASAVSKTQPKKMDRECKTQSARHALDVRESSVK